MSTCKKYEASYVAYIFHLLSDLKITSLQSHLQNCADCRQHVDVLKKVLRLTDSAEANISSATKGVDDIEIRVYKRLAAEPRKQQARRGFPSRLAHSLRLTVSYLRIPAVTGRMLPINLTPHWCSALAVCALVLGLIISSVFFDGKESATLAPASIEIVPASERIDQYQWQGIRRSLADVFVMKHLRNDEREAASRLRILHEQAQGTRYERIANEQLQVAEVSLR